MNTVNRKMWASREACRCLLCHEPPCSVNCGQGCDPAAFVRSVFFKNENGAAAYIQPEKCKNCNAPCENACIHYDLPIRIREMARIVTAATAESKQADLSLDFCGVACENPFFLSSSIVASSYEMCAAALEMGWGGIVYKTIGFLSLQEVSPRFDAIAKENAAFIGLRNLEQISDKPMEQSIKSLRQLKKNFPSKVIVASIMGQNEDEWTRLAEIVTDTGVDMIECNFSCPHMKGDGLGSDIGARPEMVAVCTAAARKGTHLPILAKMTPNLANIEAPAIAAVDAGADGIAAINTIKSLTGVLDGRYLVDGKTSVSGYSGKAVKPIALRFIYDIKSHEKLKDIPVSGMGGIETWRDAAEFIALGCGNLQITTAVMQYGYRIIYDLMDGLSRFLAEHGYCGLGDFIGRALPDLVPTGGLDRQTVVYPVFYEKDCIGCGRCYLSCRDAGHSAIAFDTPGRRPKLNANKCAGCHLCSLVCPAGSIGKSKRVLKRRGDI